MHASPHPLAQSSHGITAFVGLGANLGDAAHTLRTAIATLGQTPGVQLVRASSLYRTAPLHCAGPDYLNAVAQISTYLDPHALLAVLQAIETRAGRQRPYRYAPRTLDLDLLLFGHARIESPTLTVPHPRMHERAFVLVPLAEIAPEHVSPAQRQAVAQQCIEMLPA